MMAAPCINVMMTLNETAHNRLSVYEKNTAPLIAYYKEKGDLIPINGDQGHGSRHKGNHAEVGA